MSDFLQNWITHSVDPKNASFQSPISEVEESPGNSEATTRSRPGTPTNGDSSGSGSGPGKYYPDEASTQANAQNDDRPSVSTRRALHTSCYAVLWSPEGDGYLVRIPLPKEKDKDTDLPKLRKLLKPKSRRRAHVVESPRIMDDDSKLHQKRIGLMLTSVKRRSCSTESDTKQDTQESNEQSKSESSKEVPPSIAALWEKSEDAALATSTVGADGEPLWFECTPEERCEHNSHWKRLRARKGTAHYGCMLCRKKWRQEATHKKMSAPTAPNAISVPPLQPLPPFPVLSPSLFAVQPSLTATYPSSQSSSVTTDAAQLAYAYAYYLALSNGSSVSSC